MELPPPTSKCNKGQYKHQNAIYLNGKHRTGRTVKRKDPQDDRSGSAILGYAAELKRPEQVRRRSFLHSRCRRSCDHAHGLLLGLSAGKVLLRQRGR